MSDKEKKTLFKGFYKTMQSLGNSTPFSFASDIFANNTRTKNLNDNEKKLAIIKFLKNDVMALQQMNNDIGNNLSSQDITEIGNVEIENSLDAIYELLHILTEQVEMFAEKISQDFYE